MIDGRKLSLWTPKTFLHNLYDILWSLESISNTFEKSWFSQYFPFRILKGKYCENHDFSNVFEIDSNDHKISYKLCRNVLGVQRDNFRPSIIFPATFGQMASHILRSRKSQNLPKNRFWPKIQISIEWPILAGMMIYMAGNGSLRCFRVVLHPESISKPF